MTQKIGAFKLSAANDGVRLYDVTLTGTNLSNLSNFNLVDASGTVIATATTNTATAVTFSQINNAPVVAKDTQATYYVVADVNSNTNVGGVAITVDASATTIKGSNGNTIAVAGNDVTCNTMAIADSIIKIAQAANTSKDLGSSALKFTVTALGKNSTIMTGLTTYVSVAGLSGNAVKVYKGDTTASNMLAFSGVFTNATNTVLGIYNTGNATIDVGTPVTYTIVLDGAIGNGTNATQDWTVRLADIAFTGYLASTYNNLGSFPMTSVK